MAQYLKSNVAQKPRFDFIPEVNRWKKPKNENLRQELLGLGLRLGFRQKVGNLDPPPRSSEFIYRDEATKWLCRA